MALTDKLTAVADAIRAKTGGTEAMTLDQMPTKIAAIETGGGGAEFNIAYGDTEPEDTSKLWVKTAEPAGVEIRSQLGPGNEEMDLGVAYLPLPLYNMAAATVGDKIYAFGGYHYPTNTFPTSIYMFDPATNTLSTLNTVMPLGQRAMGIAAVGTKIYLLGGYNGSEQKGIYAFDTESGEITKLSAELHEVRMGGAAAAVGKKIYIFGGSYISSSNFFSVVYAFDTESQTLTALSATLPTAVEFVAAAAVGTKIYLFGGGAKNGAKDTILVFDTETYSISTLGAVLPEPTCRMAAAAIGTTIYVFGGYTHMFGNVRKETIYAFDTVTETITTLSTTLPTGAEYVAAAAVGTQVFLFGGKYGITSDLATINRFTAAVPLAENALLIDASATQNLVELISSGTVNAQVGVANVYMGNAQGLAEKVAAAVYKDGAWVEI